MAGWQLEPPLEALLRTQFGPHHWSSAPFRRMMFMSLPRIGANRRPQNRRL